MFYEAQFASIQYCIRALKDMPGRKSLLMISPIIAFQRLTGFESFISRFEYEKMMNQLADEALRNGLVIHALDIRGLMSSEVGGPTMFQGGESVLAKKTGGITVKNSNFFVSGIGYLHEEMKGYYILSYIPPSNTFKSGDKNMYRRIKIKAKRRFSEVHTRDGFYGITMSSGDDRSNPDEVPLREAIFSPFLYDDLKVHLASGYASEPETGYFLRSS